MAIRTTFIGRALVAAVALVSVGVGGGGDEVLVADFDEGLHASVGAPNPFSASGGVERVHAGSGGGSVLHFVGHDPLPDGRPRPASEKSALIFDGRNLPAEVGTLSFRIRLTGVRRWDDGREAWIATLVPLVGEPGFTRSGEEGTGLGVLKTADGSLALGIWEFHGDRLTPYFQARARAETVAPPDETPIRLRLLDRGPAWVRVVVGWDARAGRVWLGADDRLESATLRWRGSGFRALLLGTPPLIHTHQAPAGFDGELDDLLVLSRTPEGRDGRLPRFPARIPPMARPPAAADPGEGSRLERAVRAEIDRVLSAQRGAGWPHSVAYPSRLGFLSQKVVIPFSERFFGITMDGASSHVAIRLLAAYEVLGDPACLAAARRTADAMLELQGPRGSWPAMAIRAEGRSIVHDPTHAYFKDRVQSYGVVLMARMHELTADERYAESARRAIEMIRTSQNPNGSWPYYLDLTDGRGKTIRGQLHGGEINDYATSDAMALMLVWYRRTGDPRYLGSYLRGADWFVDAFLDGVAKGWAQQYDAANRPIAGRTHEPAAVSTLGIMDPVETLIEAYWLTGDERYLAPLRKWRTWAQANRSERGWHRYYDVATGRPVRAVGGVVEPADPRDASPGHVEQALRMLDPIPLVPPSVERPGSAAFERYQREIERFLDAFDWSAGTWTAPWGPSGDAFFPADGKLMGLLWASLADRQQRGVLTRGHRLAGLSRIEWQDPISQLMPQAALFARLSPEEQRLSANGSSGLKPQPRTRR